MKQLEIPAITNPGISFTENTFAIMQGLHDCFKDTTQSRILFKTFQETYKQIDPTGDAKIRMLFPLCRKAGCIFPDEEGCVIFENGTFLTPLGTAFFKASKLYYQVGNITKSSSSPNSPTIKSLLEKARHLYASISACLFENLCESEQVYQHLLWFVRKYGPVSRDEVKILLYSLEKNSEERGKVIVCKRDESEIDSLVNEYRRGQLIPHSDKANNAAGYFIAVLKTLFIIAENDDHSFVVAT